MPVRKRSRKEYEKDPEFYAYKNSVKRVKSGTQRRGDIDVLFDYLEYRKKKTAKRK